MLLEVFPGLGVVSVILNKTGIVESSVINLEDVLLALAPLEAVGYFEEGDVVLVGAVGNASLVTAEVFHSVLAHEYSKFFVKRLLGLNVGLKGGSNGLEEFLSKLVAEVFEGGSISHELLGLLLEGSLGSLGDLEVTSAGVQAGGLEIEGVG